MMTIQLKFVSYLIPNVSFGGNGGFFMLDCDTYVSEDRITLWKQLSSLHYVNRETDKRCKRTRKSSPGTTALDDGSRIMRPGLYDHLRTLRVSIFGAMLDLGASRAAFSFALSCNDL